MRKFFLLLVVLVASVFGKPLAQCDATFIPSFFEPIVGQQVNFFYWGGIPANPAWDYKINYGYGADVNGSFPLTYNNLGSTTYSTPGIYTVVLTVFDLTCTTTYSMDLEVIAATGGCSAADFAFTPEVQTCIDMERTLAITLVNPLTYPLDHVEWNMGDGNIINTTTTSVTYSYPDDGVYFVTANVFVQDGSGLCSRYAKGQTAGPSGTIDVGYYSLRVHDGEPEFVMTPANPVAGNTVTFTYVGDYSLLPPTYHNTWMYHWTVDGGTPSSGLLTYGMSFPGYPSPGISAGNHTVSLYLDSPFPTQNSCRQGDTVTFYVPPYSCDTCNSFKPIPGKTYWLSAWVQEENGTTQIATHNDVSITLGFVNGTPASSTLVPTGDIIDGWQRIAGEFTIPAGTTDLEVKLNAGDQLTYFDDIRIHPFNGSMKSYVYDGQTFWLMSELDDNNYATFYEYDAEGGLIRIKKETSGGIVTIQETRSSTIKITP